VVLGLMCVLVIAACGKRSDGTKGASIPSDLDSMAFEPESARVRADIDSGNAQFLQAWRTGSADLFANTFAEDGAQLLQGGRHVLGRDSIAAHMNRVFSKIRMRRGSITTLDLNIVGDRAYERGKYVFETVPVKGGKAEIDSGHFVEIWKYEQGQWKMWRDIGVPRD
jgi:uncharacterized protein (TIGR02246 family)